MDPMNNFEVEIFDNEYFKHEVKDKFDLDSIQSQMLYTKIR